MKVERERAAGRVVGGRNTCRCYERVNVEKDSQKWRDRRVSGLERNGRKTKTHDIIW